MPPSLSLMLTRRPGASYESRIFGYRFIEESRHGLQEKLSIFFIILKDRELELSYELTDVLQIPVVTQF
ncbi:hypothetical protein N9A90_03700 [Akkermansiaceae bacterium]|nr:hypothetical protein [Akkermansiaceae bacterium]